jgi:futalosine hydrolase
MVATTYHLTKALNNSRPDLALLVGIGGSFNRNIPLGEVVLITSDQYGDMGAEDNYNFLDIFELGLEQLDDPPISNGLLANPVQNLPVHINLPEVSGISVNTVAGTSFTATSRREKYKSQIESMEGAAFHFVCLSERVAFAQVRAISNYVEARDKNKWEMQLAIQNLNNWTISFLESLP